MTYKMGTRAGLGAVKDKSLPWLGSKAPSIEVAADVTGIYRILIAEHLLGGENRESAPLPKYQSNPAFSAGLAIRLREFRQVFLWL